MISHDRRTLLRLGRVSLLAALLPLVAASAELPQAGTAGSRVRTQAQSPLAQSPLSAALSFAWLGLRIDQPLSYASGGPARLSIKYTGAGSGPVTSLLVPGSGTYALGPLAGSFETALDVDLRLLLRREEAQMLARCKTLLEYNRVESIDSTYDVVLPLTLLGPDEIPVASTSLAYQLGLRCRNPPPPLAVALGYTRIEVNVNQPLSRALGGQVPLTVTYHGEEAVSSVQFTGRISLPISRPGSFLQTFANLDVRPILQADEAAILARCRAGTASRFDTVHDVRMPVTVNRANGSVIVETVLDYQLGLTCQK